MVRKVKVELVGQPREGRLTLALYAAADPVRSLWAQMKTESLEKAVSQLAAREGCRRDQIGRWPNSNSWADRRNIPGLEAWAASKGVDHVIWTGRELKFSDVSGKAPSPKEAVQYLKNLKELDSDSGAKAKKYVRCAPRQIKTRYRKRFVRCLGTEWEAASDAECE